MRDILLRRHTNSATGWLLLGSNDEMVAGPLPWREAVTTAVALIERAGNGTVRSVGSDGAIRVVRTVRAVASENDAADPPAQEAGVEDKLGDKIETVAGQIDLLTGRSEIGPPSLRDKVEDIDVQSVLPRSIRNNRAIKIINTNVSAAAAGVAAVGVVFTGGGISAVVAAARGASAGTATVGSYAAVWQAFFATLALSVCAAVLLFALRSNLLKSYGAVAVLFAVFLAIVWLAARYGFAGPSVDDVLEEFAKVSNPIAKAASVFGVFLVFYGPAPFLCGAIAGSFAGNIAYKLQTDDEDT